jgi:UDP-GlcNAc:undecaprenyl-phosphate/decaprenyl-phosphate GlcNAc-1-phosphate transferase
VPIAAAFLASFGLTALLVPVVGRIARARGVYAQPTYDRWHQRPVPNVGGIAMLLPVLIVCAAGGLLPAIGPLLLASTLMFLLGLVDDLSPVRPASKLVIQMLIAAVLLYLLPPVRLIGEPTLDLMLAFVWIVGITNAVNLLDNIDGLAAGIVAIAGGFFILVLWIDQPGAADPLSLSVAALVGAAAAFLIYNFHPASIFMGDGGSHLLGSFLAGATLMAAPRLDAHLAPVSAIPIVLLLIPIFDTVFVTVLRRLSGRSAFLGGRDHTSHRLVALGLGERRAVLVLYTLATIGGAVALGLATMRNAMAWGLVGLYVALLTLVGFYLSHVRVQTSMDDAWHPLPSDIASRHRAFEVIVDAVLLGTAYYLAFLVRFRAPQFDEFLPYFTRSIPIVVASQVAAMWMTGKYRKAPARLGPVEIFGLAQRTVVGVGASVIAVLYLTRFQGYSRSVFVMDAVFAPILVVGARVAVSRLDAYLRLRRSRGRTALVYGAGRTGLHAVRELLQNGAHGLTPIGVIDDAPFRLGTRVEGVPVLGTLDELPAIIARLGTRRGRLSAVIVAIDALSREKSDQLSHVCETHHISVSRLRVALEQVGPRRPSGVIRFPGA